MLCDIGKLDSYDGDLWKFQSSTSSGNRCAFSSHVTTRSSHAFMGLCR